MTMTIPTRSREINQVSIVSFDIRVENASIVIVFDYQYKDQASSVSTINRDILVLNEQKYTQLLNTTPPGNKTFKKWIRPLIYAEIANYLGVPVGQID